MTTLINGVVPAMTFIVLAVIGLDLTGADFARVRRQRGLVLAGVLLPLVALPTIATALTSVFVTDAPTRIGMLLVAAAPIGGLASSFTYLSGISPALSVSLTGLSCVASAAAIPLVISTAAIARPESVTVTASAALLTAQALIVLALPVAVGMTVRTRWPSMAAASKASLHRLAAAAVAVVVLLIIIDDVDAFVEQLSTAVPLAVAFVVVAGTAGWVTATLFTDDPGDRFTMAVAFGTRNIGVAAAVAISLLGHAEFARFAAAYFLTEVPLMLLCAWWFRRPAVAW